MVNLPLLFLTPLVGNKLSVNHSCLFEGPSSVRGRERRTGKKVIDDWVDGVWTVEPTYG